MNNRIFISSSLIFLLLSSCSIDKKKTIILDKCPNKEMIIYSAYSTQKIKINFNDSFDKIVEKLENTLKSDLCELTKFGLISDDNKAFEVVTNVRCNDQTGSQNSESLELLINKENQILLVENIVHIDSLEDKLFEILKVNNHYESIRITWSSIISDKEILKIIEQLKKGVALYYEDISISLFETDLCNLSLRDLGYLKKKFRVDIFLDIENIID